MKNRSSEAKKPARGGLAAEARELKEQQQGEPKATAKGKGKGKKAAKPAEEREDRHKGFSRGAVIKQLGKNGVTTAHAKAIAAAMGWEFGPDSVAWYVSAGRTGRGKVAELSKADLDELIAKAPAPAEEETSGETADK